MLFLRDKKRRRISLDVAVYPKPIHGTGTAFLVQRLEQEPSVRCLEAINELETIEKLCAESKVNTIFMMPCLDNYWEQEFEDFILNIRQKYPRVIFVLYMSSKIFKKLW